MIPQFAIKKFLNEPRDDHRWLKQLTDKDVVAAIRAIKPVPNLTPGLRKSQKVGFLLGVAYPQFCFWYDMGAGKTLLSLELLRYWWEQKKLRRALVFVKSDKAFPTWEKQVKLWNINIPYITLDQPTSHEKWHALAAFRYGLVFVTYPSAVNMTTLWVKGKKGKKGRKGKNHMALDTQLVDTLGAGVDAIILDESTSCGHHNSLTTKLCARLRRNAKFCYALAGRPFGRDPTMLWSQHNIVDGGQTLGETLGLFREAFFDAEDNPWDPKGYAKDFKFKKNLLPRLMEIVQHRSISYSADECGIKTDFLAMVEEAHLPEEVQAYYKKVVENIIAAKGNLKEMKNAFMRMRQLSSGFLGFRNSSEDRVEIAFDENPKLDRLLELIEEVPYDRAAVIFYEFTHSGRRITEELRKLGHKPVWLWSGTKDSRGDLKKFQEDPEVRFAVIQSKVGAYSLDGLQTKANYMFFYESPVSPIDREQAEFRLRRPGQPFKVLQYDLVVKGTLDQRILDFHKEGDDLLKALHANPEKILEG